MTQDRAERIAKVILFSVFAAVLYQCTGDDPPEPPLQFTESGIKTLSPSIDQVKIDERQRDHKDYAVTLNLQRDPFTGDAQDWNNIAAESNQIAEKLFAESATAELNLVYFSPANNNLDWARITFERESLPQDWENLTYLQLFSYAQPIPGTLEAGQWLCDFYQQYESAQPNLTLPDHCIAKLLEK